MMFTMLMRTGKRRAPKQLSSFESGRWLFLSTTLGVPLASMIIFTLFLFPLVETVTTRAESNGNSTSNKAAGGNHIKELIPDRFQKKYQKWKSEFLSTQVGREQWERYARNVNFTLTIIVSEDRGKGAGTEQYRWNDNGQLIAATITLGDQADEGYPNPFNYPVTSSLAHAEPSYPIDGSVLAATKMAHEFGHVNWVAATDARFFQLQNKLIPIYNRILLSNGRNVHDPKLVELAKQMSGTPVEIAQDRELWAEANALTFLRERCPEDGEYKSVFTAIKHAVESYAKEHVERFR